MVDLDPKLGIGVWVESPTAVGASQRAVESRRGDSTTPGGATRGGRRIGGSRPSARPVTCSKPYEATDPDSVLYREVLGRPTRRGPSAERLR
jgi:hypothetical protein